MDCLTCPKSEPGIVLRQETDDWALLFNPDTGDTFGLDPTGVLIWRLADGTRTTEEICLRIRDEFSNVPDNVHELIASFLAELHKRSLVTYLERTPA